MFFYTDTTGCLPWLRLWSSPTPQLKPNSPPARNGQGVVGTTFGKPSTSTGLMQTDHNQAAPKQSMDGTVSYRITLDKRIICRPAPDLDRETRSFECFHQKSENKSVEHGYLSIS